MTTPMSWDGYVTAWAAAFEGFDVTQAGRAQRHWLRASYRLGVTASRAGVPAAGLLASSVCAAIAVPALAPSGPGGPALAAGVLLLGVGLDTLARTVGILTGKTTRLGEVYHSLAERFAELCWLVALVLLGARPGLAVACGMVALMHEYVRARARSAGLRSAASATIGDRPARVWLTAAALLLAALAQQIGSDLGAGVVTMFAATWLCLGVIGVGQLIAILRRALR